MNLVFAISGSGRASPEDAPVYVGLGIVALGLLALVFRQQCYLAYQWIRPYPGHGPIYVLIHFVGPAVAIVGGISLIASRFLGS